jgi:hypothetical protein
MPPQNFENGSPVPPTHAVLGWDARLIGPMSDLGVEATLSAYSAKLLNHTDLAQVWNHPTAVNPLTVG